MWDIYSKSYLAKKKEILDRVITKAFMVDLQEELKIVFKLKKSYMLGNHEFTDFAGTNGGDVALKAVSEKHNANELIDFLESLDWYEYDDVTYTIFYGYARRYRLYTPKERWRNICKAEALMLRKKE